MSGYIGNRFDYGSSISYQDQGQTSLNINGTFRTNYTTIGASFGQSDTYQQEMINLNGSLVAHSQGIYLAQTKYRPWYWYMRLKRLVLESAIRLV